MLAAERQLRDLVIEEMQKRPIWGPHLWSIRQQRLVKGCSDAPDILREQDGLQDDRVGLGDLLLRGLRIPARLVCLAVRFPSARLVRIHRGGRRRSRRSGRGRPLRGARVVPSWHWRFAPRRKLQRRPNAELALCCRAKPKGGPVSAKKDDMLRSSGDRSDAAWQSEPAAVRAQAVPSHALPVVKRHKGVGPASCERDRPRTVGGRELDLGRTGHSEQAGRRLAEGLFAHLTGPGGPETDELPPPDTWAVHRLQDHVVLAARKSCDLLCADIDTLSLAAAAADHRERAIALNQARGAKEVVERCGGRWFLRAPSAWQRAEHLLPRVQERHPVRARQAMCLAA
mmetsp:Transcript_17757/g.56771  ORF Transcript_17757/g.56771 Transcript_17757/m.56771 type:complete len:342 (-) Transcript_17757:47-1072(-)